MLDKSRSSVVLVKAVLTLRSVHSSIELIYLSKMAAKNDFKNQVNLQPSFL